MGISRDDLKTILTLVELLSDGPKTSRPTTTSRRNVSENVRAKNPDASNAYGQVMALDAPYGTKKSIAGFAARLVADQGNSVEEALNEAKGLIAAIEKEKEPRDAMRFFLAVREANAIAALTSNK